MGALADSSPDLWFKADAITGLVDGDPVATWVDSSGHSRDATSSGTNRPTYKTNVSGSLPGVLFDGTSDYMLSSMSASNAAQTIIAVVRPTGAGTARAISGSNPDNGTELRLSTGDVVQILHEGVAAMCSGTRTAATSAVHVVAGTYDAATGSAVRTDGGNDFLRHSRTVAASTTTILGARGSLTELFSGHILEYARWARILTSSEFAAIESEMAAKWSATSLVGHAAVTAITPTASSTAGGWDPWHLFDGVVSDGSTNSWSATANPPGWVKAQLSTTAVVTSYKIGARTDAASSAPGSWTFEGSNDNSTWTTLDTRSSETFTAGQTKTYAATNSTAYSYYRLSITATGGAAWPSFSEWTLVQADASSSTTGTVAASLPSLSASIAGTVSAPTTTGTVGASLPSLSASVAGNVAGVTAGAVGASLPSLSASIAGTIPTPVTGAVAATLPSLSASVRTGNPTLGSFSLNAKAPLTVNMPTITLVPLAVDLKAKASLTVNTRPVKMLAVSLEAKADLRVTLPRHMTVDPVTGLPQYRLMAVAQDGTQLGELPKAVIGDYTSGLSLDDENLTFTLPKYDATNALVTARRGDPVREVQLWRGPNLEAWVKVDGDRASDTTVDYDCSSLAGYLKGRVVGKTPKTDWLVNGNFTSGEYGWSFGYAPGSKPAAAPTHSVVSVDFSGAKVKALKLGGADTVTETKSAVETAAVFVPNSATYLSGGEAIIQAAAADIPNGTNVHIVGHTAYNYLDGDYGDGLALSLNRAQAARATLAAMGKGFTFSLPSNWSSIDPSKRVDDGTVGGRGRYAPVASNDTYAGQAKNRRVEFSYLSTVTYEASAEQYAQGSLITGTITVPASTKRALPVTFRAYAYLGSITKAAKGGYGARITLAKASAPTVLVQDEHTDLNEDSPVGTWDRHTATVTVPANGVTYVYTVRLYAPKGEVLWTMAGVYPAEALHFPDTDRALIVKGLVEHAQDPSMGKLGDTPVLLGTRTPLTGYKLTATYPYHERREILDAAEEHSAVWQGVDLAVETTPTTRAIATHYPRRGQVSGVTFELGSNVVAYEAPTSVTDATTRSITQALESSGAEREEGIVTDLSGLGGVLVETVSYGESGTPITALAAAAKATVAREGHPVTDLTVTIGRVGRWDPALTSWMLDHVGVGDLVDVVIVDGTTSIVGTHRVIRRILTPETDTLRYVLAPEVEV